MTNEILAMLEILGYSSKVNLKSLPEMEFYKIMSMYLFNDYKDALGLKKDPKSVMEMLKVMEFPYKLDEKTLRTISMPHNTKVRNMLLFHILKKVFLI